MGRVEVVYAGTVERRRKVPMWRIGLVAAVLTYLGASAALSPLATRADTLAGLSSGSSCVTSHVAWAGSLSGVASVSIGFHVVSTGSPAQVRGQWLRSSGAALAPSWTWTAATGPGEWWVSGSWDTETQVSLAVGSVGNAAYRLDTPAGAAGSCFYVDNVVVRRTFWSGAGTPPVPTEVTAASPTTGAPTPPPVTAPPTPGPSSVAASPVPGQYCVWDVELELYECWPPPPDGWCYEEAWLGGGYGTGPYVPCSTASDPPPAVETAINLYGGGNLQVGCAPSSTYSTFACNYAFDDVTTSEGTAWIALNMAGANVYQGFKQATDGQSSCWVEGFTFAQKQGSRDRAASWKLQYADAYTGPWTDAYVGSSSANVGSADTIGYTFGTPLRHVWWRWLAVSGEAGGSDGWVLIAADLYGWCSVALEGSPAPPATTRPTPTAQPTATVPPGWTEGGGGGSGGGQGGTCCGVGPNALASAANEIMGELRSKAPFAYFDQAVGVLGDLNEDHLRGTQELPCMSVELPEPMGQWDWCLPDYSEMEGVSALRAILLAALVITIAVVLLTRATEAVE